jgi:DNA-binding PadR family transcriptional regulator
MSTYQRKGDSHERRQAWVLRLLDKSELNFNQMHSSLAKEGVPRSRSSTRDDLYDLRRRGLVESNKVPHRGLRRQTVWEITPAGKSKLSILVRLGKRGPQSNQSINQFAERKFKVLLDRDLFGYPEMTFFDVTACLTLHAEPVLSAKDVLDRISKWIGLKSICESVVDSLLSVSYDARFRRLGLPKNIKDHFRREKTAMNLRANLRIEFNGRSNMKQLRPKDKAREAKALIANRQEQMRLIRAASSSHGGRREVLQAMLHELIRVRRDSPILVLHQLVNQFWRFASLSNPPSYVEIVQILNEWEGSGLVTLSPQASPTKLFWQKPIPTDTNVRGLIETATVQFLWTRAKRFKALQPLPKPEDALAG